jgi:HSP20 family protein
MANVTRYDPRDPFGELVDDLFKGFLVRPVSTALEGRGGDLLPRMKVDVAEKDGAYVVTAEMPGVKKEDIHVTVDGAQVTIDAEVKREKTDQDERTLHSERIYGRMTRSFTLPQEIDESKVDAKFKDGLLELTLPKKQPQARKEVSIQ